MLIIWYPDASWHCCCCQSSPHCYAWKMGLTYTPICSNHWTSLTMNSNNYWRPCDKISICVGSEDADEQQSHAASFYVRSAHPTILCLLSSIRSFLSKQRCDQQTLGFFRSMFLSDNAHLLISKHSVVNFSMSLRSECRAKWLTFELFR